MIEIVSYDNVSGLKFGSSESDALNQFGAPERIDDFRSSRELCYPDFIVRIRKNSGVFDEFTLLPGCEAMLNGHVISWDIEFLHHLARQGGDLKENVGFVVSEKLGISAAGLHQEDDVAIHAFARGTWDDLLKSMMPFSLPE